ncbi:MAG: arginase [Phycisphaerae bacterium]
MRIKLVGIAAGKGAGTPGAEEGPLTLRRAGLVARLAALGHHVDDLGDIPGVYETRFHTGHTQHANFLPHVVQVNRHTHACVLGTLRKSPDAFVLIIGGDHSLAIGALAGLSDACQRLGLIWIDAHGDFNTPNSSPTGNLHGMSLAVACGRGLPELRAIADRDPLVSDEDVYLLGCRDLDPPEAEALRASRVHVVPMAEWRTVGLVESAVSAAAALRQRCDHIHLSFDIDVLDAGLVPGTGTRVAGGMTREQARDVLAALGDTGVIESAEIVEFNPRLDRNGATCEITLSLIDALFGAGRAPGPES